MLAGSSLYASAVPAFASCGGPGGFILFLLEKCPVFSVDEEYFVLNTVLGWISREKDYADYRGGGVTNKKFHRVSTLLFTYLNSRLVSPFSSSPTITQIRQCLWIRA